MSLLRGQDKIEEVYFSQDNGPRLSTDETKYRRRRETHNGYSTDDELLKVKEEEESQVSV